MRLSLFSVLLLLNGWLLPAQSPSYVHYGVSEGLPSNKVYCVLQDYRGFIWFGTDKGLVRFDGTHFQVYGVKEGLPDPEVLSLFEDSRHRLWISCFSQRPSYMLDGRLITAKNDSLLAQINIGASLWEYSEDDNHQVWIAGKTSTVFVFNGTTIRSVKYAVGVSRVEQIGNLLFGLGAGFIMQNELGLMYKVVYEPDISKALTVSDRFIVYSRAHWLTRFEWRDGALIKLDSCPSREGGVFTDNKGRLWLCPATKGSICFDNNRHDFSNPVLYLQEEKVNSMLRDRNGTLWFCTSGNGVFVLSPGKASTYTHADGLVTNNITAIARDPWGNILAGDDIGSFYRLSAHRIREIPLEPTGAYNRCRQILALPDHSYWFASDQGLYHQSGSTFRKATASIGVFSGLKVILNTADRIWYGNHYSIGFMDPDRMEEHIVVKKRTTALCQDASGNIWSGRLDGVFSQRDSFQINWGDTFPALKNRIVALQPAGADKIWVVTPEAGLLLATVHQGRLTGVEQINQYLPRPIENIQSIFVEPVRGGRVWMATNRGVYGLNPANWTYVHFDQHDGLADNDVNCILVALDTLWAGTVAGLSCFPLSSPSDTNEFSTFITGLHYQSAGRAVFMGLLDSLLPAHQVILPPDAAMVTLSLTGLNYRSQGNLVYECVTTERFPPPKWWTRRILFDWIKNGFKSKADTTVIDGNSLNLGLFIPSGSYEIRVTAVTTQGIFSKSPDHWTIIMRPHWYNTFWFDLLLWSILAYVLWRMLHARSIFRKMNVAVSELQLQALQSQINPHFVGNSINAIQQFFYPPNPAAASNYIELFTRLLRRTILLSERHFNPFVAELAYDHDYLEMIKLRFGARFEYAITGTDAVPGDLPFPSMLLQPILENATIHGLAPEGISRLQLQFSYKNGKLQCIITDNGMGYKASKARVTSKPVEQKSKGLELLEKKVLAFNQLYAINLRLEMTDLSDAQPPGIGTRVLIAFRPGKIKRP